MNAPAEISMVHVHQAKTHHSKLLARARRGEEVILAKDGVPVDKMVPYEASAAKIRVRGRWPELASIPDSVWFDPLPEEELAWWEGRGYRDDPV